MNINKENLLDHESQLNTLRLIGTYISNSILLQKFSKPKPLLDVNKIGLLQRVFLVKLRSDVKYETALIKIAHKIGDSSYSNEINWTILGLAVTFCKRQMLMLFILFESILYKCSIIPILKSQFKIKLERM
jgi:adenine-specific DNA glycosylase